MKKYIPILTSVVIFIFTINGYSDSGEGISNVGILSSYNNTNTIIITHGFTSDIAPLPYPITASKWKHYVWQFAMANAVSNNRDIYLIRKGNVFKIDKTLAQFQDFTSNQLNTPIEDLIGQPNQFVINSNKDNVFIFDWTLESAINADGYAEAAADVLAATLVRLGADYPFLLEHIHFIGFSRGCVVNSEAIERLMYWASNGMLPTGVNLDPSIHMTTLDPHPAGHWTAFYFGALGKVYMNDDGVNSSKIGGVTGWKSTASKTAYIDNYYQTWLTAGFIGLNNYPGLNKYSSIANNNLTDKFTIWSTSQHNLVHTWYYGTVNSLASNDNFEIGSSNITRTTAWYNADLGKTQGFCYSLNRSNYLSSIPSLQANLVPIDNDNKYGTNKLIFNGDFTKINTTYESPGWSYQGGTSLINILNNQYAILTNNYSLLDHNPLYFPTNITQVWFRMSVPHPSNINKLQVFISNNLIKSYDITQSSQSYAWESFPIPDSYRGKVADLSFKLTTNDSKYTEVHIKDVSFYPIIGISVKVACPVDFHIYDQYGNHTGPTSDSTYAEEIPGSEYFIYQDSTGDKVKTVRLKPLASSDANYTFKIISRDTTASFDLQIENYSDTTHGTVSYQFNNIPIKQNTVATCSIDNNVQLPKLDVDTYGNGVIDTVYIALPDTTLPVELTSFTASIIDKNVKLIWNTVTEVNSSLFEVEKKTSNKNAWQKIAAVKAAGNSTEPKLYSYIDKNINTGKYSYRLKMVDLDGTYKYSNVVDAEITAPLKFELSNAYPNPWNPTTTIRYQVPVSILVTLKVFDALGKEVATLVEEVKPAGSYEATFNARNLSSGVYYYQIKAGSFVETKKLLLLK